MSEVQVDLSDAKLTGQKVWLIFDSRAHVMDTDDCVVYEAFSSYDETLESVKKALKEDWKDGVAFEYDEVHKDGVAYIVNQRRIE